MAVGGAPSRGCPYLPLFVNGFAVGDDLCKHDHCPNGRVLAGVAGIYESKNYQTNPNRHRLKRANRRIQTARDCYASIAPEPRAWRADTDRTQFDIRLRPLADSRRHPYHVWAMKLPLRLGIAGLSIAATVVCILAEFAPLPALAAGSDASATNAPAKIGDVDAKIRTFIQKHFLIGDPTYIQIGPPVQTGVKDVVMRQVTVRNDQGQQVKAQAFTDATGDEVILGQIYDLTKDPWPRADASTLRMQDRPTLGQADAPVTIVEFADFECPFCARAFGVIESMVNSTYKGKLKLVFKNYPLNVHPWAMRAALGAECARLQNPQAFWEFARDFYSNQGSINPQNVDAHIDATAKRLNLDLTTLHACMANKTTTDRIAEDEKDGTTVGINSTPSFLVNGVKVVGLPEDKNFDFVIKEQLAEASKTAH